MKKILPLPLVTAILAGTGFFLRRWHLATAWEAESGLAIPGAPATWALIGVLLAGLVLTAVLAKLSVREYGGYLDAFHYQNPWVRVPYFIAGAVLVKAGIDGIIDHVRMPGLGMMRLILACLFVAAGAFVAVISTLGHRNEVSKGRELVPLVVPGYVGCLWLVYAYQRHTANPELLEYVVYLVGIVAAILALYTIAGFSFEKRPHPFRCAWYCSAACILLVTDLADWRSPMEGSAEIGLTIFLFTQLTLLLYRGQNLAELLDCPPETEELTLETGENTHE